jgi:hypothetical protein
VWYGANKVKAKLYRENKKREKELAEVVEKSFNTKTPEFVAYTSKENKEKYEKAIEETLKKTGVKPYQSVAITGEHDWKKETEIPPMPVKEKGENSLDFAARKSEWKKKYG